MAQLLSAFFLCLSILFLIIPVVKAMVTIKHWLDFSYWEDGSISSMLHYLIMHPIASAGFFWLSKQIMSV